MEETPSVDAPDSAPKSNLPRIALGIVAVVALFLLAREAGQYIPQAAEWVDGLGPWGPLAFIVLYAAGVVAFLPGALLTLAGGAIKDCRVIDFIGCNSAAYCTGGRRKRFAIPRLRPRASVKRRAAAPGSRERGRLAPVG